MDTASIFLFKNQCTFTLACCGVTQWTLLQAKLPLFLLERTQAEDSTALHYNSAAHQTQHCLPVIGFHGFVGSGGYLLDNHGAVGRG
jgi:hypothetical protein